MSTMYKRAVTQKVAIKWLTDAEAKANQVSADDTAEKAEKQVRLNFRQKHPELFVAEHLGLIKIYFENPKLDKTNYRFSYTPPDQHLGVWFNAEIERIDQAILKFEEGVGILHGEQSNVAEEKPAKSVAQAIEIILNDAGEPLHVKRITERLRFLGYQTAESTVSGTLQTYAKKKKKFKKTAPATFGVLEKKSKAAKGAG